MTVQGGRAQSRMVGELSWAQELEALLQEQGVEQEASAFGALHLPEPRLWAQAAALQSPQRPLPGALREARLRAEHAGVGGHDVGLLAAHAWSRLQGALALCLWLS